MGLSKNQISILERLKRKGLSYREIKDKVDFEVSLGTLSNKLSDVEVESKCSLDISKDKFFSIFRDTEKTPNGNVLMLPKYKERIEEDENFNYVVEELEKFIEKVE